MYSAAKRCRTKDTDSPAVTQPADGEPDGTGDADNTAKDPEGDQKGGQSGNGDGNTDKSTVTTTKPAASNVITTDATPYQSGGVYIVGNAGYEMYNYVGSLAEKYQSTVNAVADSLSGVSNVYAMAIPLSSSITLPDSPAQRHTRQRSGTGRKGYSGGNGAEYKNGAPA